MKVTVLTYNILDGGMQREHYLHDVITTVQPDIIVLQELFTPSFLYALAHDLHANAFFAPSNTQRHLGLISRYPFLRTHAYRLLPIRTALLEASLLLPTQRVLHLWGVHLMPHLGFPFELWRAAEIQSLLQRTKAFQSDYCMIVGDCNAIAPSESVLIHALPPQLKRVVLAQGGRVYHWAITKLLEDNWTDCYRHLHTDTGWTLPSHCPNARLDYIFANPQLIPLLQECRVVDDIPAVQKASDHLPVRAVFSLQ